MLLLSNILDWKYVLNQAENIFFPVRISFYEPIIMHVLFFSEEAIFILLPPCQFLVQRALGFVMGRLSAGNAVWVFGTNINWTLQRLI